MHHKLAQPQTFFLTSALSSGTSCFRNETPAAYRCDRFGGGDKLGGSCHRLMVAWPNETFTPEPVDPRFAVKWEDRPRRQSPPFLIDGVIRGGSLTILYGPSGSGKSLLALEMLNAVTNGLPFKGRRTRVRKTLYVDYEMGEAILREYGDKLGLSGYITPMHDVPLAAIPDLLRAAKRAGCEVIVFDSYASLANQTGDDNAVNSNTVAEKVLKPLADLAHKLGLAIIVLHHTRKDGTMFEGAQRIKGLSDAMLRLNLNQTTGQMGITADKVRGPFEPLSWEAKEHPNLRGSSKAPAETGVPDQDAERRAWLLEALRHGPVMLAEVNARFKAEFNKHSKRLEHVIKAALEEGLIQRTMLGKQAQLSLAPAALLA